MKDKVFLDTNIIYYSYSNTEIEKRDIARKLIYKSDSFVSTQVIQELINTITKKLGYNYNDVINVVNEVTQNNSLSTNSKLTISKGCEIAEKYKYSFYDSLIIAAALESNCTILYSEDMQHNQII